MHSTNDDHLSMTSILFALAVLAISVAGVMGNAARAATDELDPDDTSTVTERSLSVDLPVTGDLTVSTVGAAGGEALVISGPDAPTIAIEDGSGALVAVHETTGRLVGLAMVPPDLSPEVRTIAVSVDTTALAMVGLSPGLTSADSRVMAANWAVATGTSGYEHLIEAVESAVRLNFDLAAPPRDVAVAVAATVDTTLAILADAAVPVDLSPCETAVTEDTPNPGPDVCVRQRSEHDVMTENGQPRWGLLVPAGPAGAARSLCSLVPPATTPVMLDDPVRDLQLEKHLERLVGIGKPDELAGGSAVESLSGTTEAAVWPVVLGPACPDDLVLVAAGEALGLQVLADEAQLFTILTRHATEIGPYLGGLLQGEDPVGTILEAPTGAREVVGRLESDPELDDINNAQPADVAARNRSIVAASVKMLETDSIRAAVGLRLDADTADPLVEVGCGACTAATFEPLGMDGLRSMLERIAASVSTPMLFVEDYATRGVFEIDSGSPDTTTPIETTTTAAPPVTTAPPATTPPPTDPPGPHPSPPPFTGPPVTIITRVSFSLSYPTMDDSGSPVSISFSVRNTGTAAVTLTPSDFWLEANGANRNAPTGASFETMSLSPGEEKPGSLDFGPPAGSTPDTFGVTTAKLSLEIPL